MVHNGQDPGPGAMTFLVRSTCLDVQNQGNSGAQNGKRPVAEWRVRSHLGTWGNCPIEELECSLDAQMPILGVSHIANHPLRQDTIPETEERRSSSV